MAPNRVLSNWRWPPMAEAVATHHVQEHLARVSGAPTPRWTW